MKLGCDEIRLSLKTGYFREAKRLATVLSGALKMALSGDHMLSSYQKIRSRMDRLLQDFTIRDTQPLDSPSIKIPEWDLNITLHEILQKRYEGDFLTERQVLTSPPSTPVPVPAKNEVTEQPVPVMYSQAMEKYIQDKLDDGKWKLHSLPDHKYRLVSFLDIMGDRPVSSITEEDMREFRSTLRMLPPNRSRNKAYAGKSVADILAMKPTKTLDIKTVNITVEAIATLLDWCVKKRFMQHNPAKGLQIQDKRQAIELRDPFSKNDLERIFTHPKFSEGTFKYPDYFWIPLIGLYTGMRLEEIAQLYCSDVYESETKDIWVFDINERGTDEQGARKTLKNSNSTRIVPIHNDLVRLGILDYHKSISDKGHIRLFPELTKTEATAKAGKQPSKQFKSIISNVLEISEKKSFYSLRHTFANFYKQRGIQNDAFRQLFGHEIPELSANQYGGKFPADLLYEQVVSKLDYGFDLPEKLAKSKYSKKK
jgi:integrase